MDPQLAETTTWAQFWDAYELFRDPMLCALIAGSVLGAVFRWFVIIAVVIGITHLVMAAEGGDFQQILTEHHMHDLEATPDHPGAPEQLHDLLGGRVGRQRSAANQRLPLTCGTRPDGLRPGGQGRETGPGAGQRPAADLC